MWHLCSQNSTLVAAPDAQDLALLLEVTELYCLVSPSSGTAGSPEVVTSHAWLALMQAVKVCPYPVLARFAATCGEALLSIAEYLVEDVLLVASGAVAGFSSSSSSSSRKCSPEAGGQNPAVTLEHRVKWAQDAMSMLCFLMSEQHDRDEQSPKSVDFPDNEGEQLAAQQKTLMEAELKAVQGAKNMLLIEHAYCPKL
jgi:hypothetical protein